MMLSSFKLSPLRGLSPRPYAYEAHALPAELRRHMQQLFSDATGKKKQLQLLRAAAMSKVLEKSE